MDAETKILEVTSDVNELRALLADALGFIPQGWHPQTRLKFGSDVKMFRGQHLVVVLTVKPYVNANRQFTCMVQARGAYRTHMWIVCKGYIQDNKAWLEYKPGISQATRIPSGTRR